MAGPTILALAELSDGAPTRLSLELATLATELAAAAGGRSIVACIGRGAADGATEVARYAAEVLADEADTEGDTPAALVIAAHLVTFLGSTPADLVLVPASPDGKDVAGIVAARLGLPVLVNAAGVSWLDGGPVVEMSTFGGRLITRSGFTAGGGIIVVRPGAATARERGRAGEVIDRRRPRRHRGPAGPCRRARRDVRGRGLHRGRPGRGGRRPGRRAARRVRHHRGPR